MTAVMEIDHAAKDRCQLEILTALRHDFSFRAGLTNRRVEGFCCVFFFFVCSIVLFLWLFLGMYRTCFFFFFFFFIYSHGRSEKACHD